MRSTLDELITELAELKAFVESSDPVNSALAGHNNTVVQKYVSIRRRFDYAAFAVALYASFEKFIEGLVAAFAQLESRRLQYPALPQKLVKKHLSRTAEMLSRGRIGEGRYVSLTELEVVKNLFECLNGTRPYTLNEAAVVAHDLNLRVGEIDALFATVGFEQVCERVRRADVLVEWYRDLNGLTATPQGGVPTATIEERLKDIVERRNQVAHRGGNPVNLPGVAAMSEAVGFIENFSRSIFGLLIGHYLKIHHAASENRIELALRAGDGPFKNGTIVVIDVPSDRLFVGQPVFVVVETTGARWGRIQSLRIDDTDVVEVVPSANAPNGIGVGLDFKYPQNISTQLIALAADDELVWSPAES